MDLYYMPGSAAMVVHAVLEEVGADYRLVRVVKENGRITPPELARLNPHRRVPVLVDGDQVLYEAAAIVMQLSDLHPEAGLAPDVGTAERALWYRWLTYLTNTVQATFMVQFFPSRVTGDPVGEEAIRSATARSLGGMRDFLEGELAAAGPYLLGDRFTSADLYLFMLTRWGRRLEPRWWDQPQLGAHFRRVWDRPAVQRMWEQESLDPWEDG